MRSPVQIQAVTVNKNRQKVKIYIKGAILLRDINVIGQTPLMPWLEAIIARLDHNGECRWSDMLALEYSPIHLRLFGQWRFQPSLGPGYFLLWFHQTAWCRPAGCWLGWGSMSIGDASKSHQGGLFNNNLGKIIPSLAALGLSNV